jgi:hypothetical protein
MLNSRLGVSSYSAENKLDVGLGLKLPPISTNSFAFDANCCPTQSAGVDPDMCFTVPQATRSKVRCLARIHWTRPKSVNWLLSDRHTCQRFVSLAAS